MSGPAKSGLAATLRGHLPLLVLGASLLLNERLAIDGRLADWVFSWEGNHWRYRHDALVAALLHDSAQRMAYLVYIATLLAALVSHASPRLARHRRGLRYVAATCTVCLAAVALGKAVLPIPCPWDLQRYGGHLPAGGWMHWQPNGGIKGCFPAGHATGGYALFAWYFLARHCAWVNARLLLLASLSSGLLLGLTQQVRGAHFLSHDLAAAVLCWTIARLMAHRLLYPAPSTPLASESP